MAHFPESNLLGIQHPETGRNVGSGGWTPEEVLRLRAELPQERSRLVVEELKAWAWARHAERMVLPRSGLGKAVAYMLGMWDAGLDPRAYLLEVTRRALAEPGTVTLPHDLLN